MTRLRITVRGVVQGVGFRPYVRSIAVAQELVGWVQNTRSGVVIEVQGNEPRLGSFREALSSIPAPAQIDSIEEVRLPDLRETHFSIVASQERDVAGAVLPPDLAVCDDCLREISDPGDRRHQHPFANCTRCGPRLTITLRLPYDRANTSMATFPRCPDCEREYRDAGDRRHHAQPICCPSCGPRVRLVDADDKPVQSDLSPLAASAALLLRGDVLALRGLGGFQLLVDATSEAAIKLLRTRKRRPDKALAVMFGSAEQLRESCHLTDSNQRLLTSPAAPIVLLPWASAPRVRRAVAPANPDLGAMLPYTPLHWLLLQAVGRPLVCTSGNLAEEPMCIGNADARARLKPIADAFLIHDRDVVRPVDDSVARTTARGVELLRRARGYAPLPVAASDGPCTLALGAHYKNSITTAARGQLHLSQHIGDLDTPGAVDRLSETVDDWLSFLEVTPERVACDLHPDYASTQLAERLALRWNVPLVRVQHHHAHVAALMAEHALEGRVLGLAWDGTGLGDDDTIWGSEALEVDSAGYTRMAHLKPFPLPGGDAAAREPWRSALGLLLASDLPLSAALHGMSHKAREACAQAGRAARCGVNAPSCSSMGRLFDGVAHLVLGIERCSFEGQAAIALECAAASIRGATPYPLPLDNGLADPGPLLRALLDDRRAGVDPGMIAARFHESLTQLGVDIAQRCAREQVVLGGGCFQNFRLREGLSARLLDLGFQVFLAGQVPANDGGISVGQAWVAQRRVSGVEQPQRPHAHPKPAPSV